MGEERSAKHGVFVVAPPDESSRTSLTTSPDFIVSEIAEVPGGYVARAVDAIRSLSDDELRQRLQALVGSEAALFSALEDGEGHLFIPTGNLHAVLQSAMPKEELDSWAKANGLQVVSQSKWRPKSVVLKVRSGAEADVLKALHKLKSDPEVELVQQEVLTRFRREASL